MTYAERLLLDCVTLTKSSWLSAQLTLVVRTENHRTYYSANATRPRTFVQIYGGCPRSRSNRPKTAPDPLRTKFGIFYFGYRQLYRRVGRRTDGHLEAEEVRSSRSPTRSRDAWRTEARKLHPLCSAASSVPAPQ